MGVILHNVTYRFHCLKRCFCAEFEIGTCNIICKIAHLDALETMSSVFLTRSIFPQIVKAYKDTNVKPHGSFKKIYAFLLMLCTADTYIRGILMYTKKGCHKYFATSPSSYSISIGQFALLFNGHSYTFSCADFAI